MDTARATELALRVRSQNSAGRQGEVKEAKKAKLFICQRAMSREGDGWRWSKGRPGVGAVSDGPMVEVGIFPSTSGKRPDWRVTIVIAGALVWEDWRPTERSCAVWASKKLWALLNVIGGVR